MEKKKRRVLVICAFVFAYLLIAVFVMVLFSVPEFHSPPDVRRDSSSFKGGWVALLEEGYGDRESGRPAALVMAEPVRTEGAKGDYLLEWRDEEEGMEEEVQRWVKGLQGDDEIELVGFATWYPAADDPVGSGANWEAGVRFRDAESLEPLDTESLGVPERFSKVEPPTDYLSPRLRLLFRVRGMEFPRVLAATGGDLRTGAEITYDLESLEGDLEVLDREGDWLRFDTALLAWHNTPFKVLVQVLTGEPEYAEIGPGFGEQVVVGDSLRVQWLGVEAGEVDVGYSVERFEPDVALAEPERQALSERLEDEPVAAWIEVEKKPEVDGKMVLRASAAGFLRQHCGRVLADGSVDWTWGSGSASGVNLVYADVPEGGETSGVKLVLVPEIAELSWEIGGLPDAPTPGQPENLFDVVMPRVAFEDERELFGLIGVATQLEWDFESLWDGGGTVPSSYPSDGVFRDVSPRELLRWYLAETPGSTVTYDEEEFHLEFNEDRGSFAEWLGDVVAEWMPF